MSDLLSIIQETGTPHPESLAKLLGRPVEDVESELQKLHNDGSLLGWVPLIHPSKTEGGEVKSVIEVKISPEREGGFDRLANRISKFEEVEACHLMSGAYDLLVIVKGKIFTPWLLLFPNGLPRLRSALNSHPFPPSFLQRAWPFTFQRRGQFRKASRKCLICYESTGLYSSSC